VHLPVVGAVRCGGVGDQVAGGDRVPARLAGAVRPRGDRLQVAAVHRDAVDLLLPAVVAAAREGQFGAVRRPGRPAVVAVSVGHPAQAVAVDADHPDVAGGADSRAGQLERDPGAVRRDHRVPGHLVGVRGQPDHLAVHPRVELGEPVLPAADPGDDVAARRRLVVEVLRSVREERRGGGVGAGAGDAADGAVAGADVGHPQLGHGFVRGARGEGDGAGHRERAGEGGDDGGGDGRPDQRPGSGETQDGPQRDAGGKGIVAGAARSPQRPGGQGHGQRCCPCGASDQVVTQRVRDRVGAVAQV
jgi:hypothetical protein